MKEAARLWKELGSDDKAVWADRAAKAKEEYAVAFAKFQAEHPEAASAATAGSPKRKKPKKVSDGMAQSKLNFKSAETIDTDTSDEGE